MALRLITNAGVWHTAQATGHSSVLQTLLPSVSGHSAPLPMRGVITERVRVLSPPSHVNEQLLHDAQSDIYIQSSLTTAITH